MNASTQIQYKNGQHGYWTHLCLNDTDQVKQMVDRFGNGTQLKASFQKRHQRGVDPPLKLTP